MCSSSNQAFRSPFSHLGYGWDLLLDGKLVFVESAHHSNMFFYDLASNNSIPTKVVVCSMSPQVKANAEPSDGYLEHYTNDQLHAVCLKRVGTEAGLAGWVR